MKSKGKRIGVIVLALLLLIGGGIFTVTLLHPDRFIPPDEIITRGEFAAILVRDIPLDTKGAEKDPPSFQDIDGHWSEKNIEALIDAGILDPADYPDGLFRPDEPISRAEIIKMLVRVNGKDNEARNTEGHSGYADDEEIGPDDKGYVIIGKEDGIIGDTPDNTIRPDDPVTKGEADDMIDKTKPEEPAPTPETPAPSEPGPTTPTPAPTPDKPDNGGGSGGSGGGGGSTSYPAAQVRFELPATAHTDTEILVAPVWKYMSTFIWTLTKTAADGTQQPAPDAISGMLGKEGGTIRFLQDGEYTLTATALNARGKATILSRQITVYPVADVTGKDAAKAERHFREAFSGFQKLEAQGHDDKLQYRLGWMLYTGTGTEKDITAAVAYFEKSARLGNVHAQYMLGKIYLDADSGHENIEQALRWLSKSADSGHDGAQYALGKLYRDGAHIEKNIEKAAALFTAAAEQENQYAAYALGKLYLAGGDMPKDAEAAVKWLTLSSGLGNQYAQYALAKLYLAGEDVPKNIPKAVELFTKAAEQNNMFTQYQLGKLHLLGEDIPKDVEAAVRWLTSSAEQGNQYAQYILGKLYLTGQDVPRDREAARGWFILSAEQGNVYAQFFLDHWDSFRDPSAFLAVTRLLHHLSRIFREEQRRLGGGPDMQVDSKLLRKLRQKKMAQGHAPDDHSPKQVQ